MRFQPGNPGGPGRPRGRIAKLRETMGTLSNDGATIAAQLHAIITDPSSTKKEVIEASALYLAYLVGKPEAQVNIDASVRAMAGPPAGWELLGPNERKAHLDALVTGARSATQLALPAAIIDDDDEDG